MALKYIGNSTLVFDSTPWRLSVSETGKITVSVSVLGTGAAVAAIAKKYALKIGVLFSLSDSFEGAVSASGAIIDKNPASGWTLYCRGVEFSAINNSQCRCTVKFGSDDGGSISSSTTPDPAQNGGNYELASFQNIEQSIRCAKFWREGFSVSTSGSFNSEGEMKAWKCVDYMLNYDLTDGGSSFTSDVGSMMTTLSVSQYSDVIYKMFAKRMAGISNYYVPAPTMTSVQVLRSSASLSKVGTISSPSGFSYISVPSGYSWLLSGDSLSYDGSTFKRETSWIGAEYWDVDLYS